MDLTKIDELDARQKALDEERAQSRKAVLKEIQYLINRIDAKPEELSLLERSSPGEADGQRKPMRHNLPRRCSPIPQKTIATIDIEPGESPSPGSFVFAHVQKRTPPYSRREKSGQSCAHPSPLSAMNICEREQVASMT